MSTPKAPRFDAAAHAQLMGQLIATTETNAEQIGEVVRQVLALTTAVAKAQTQIDAIATRMQNSEDREYDRVRDRRAESWSTANIIAVIAAAVISSALSVFLTLITSHP